MAGNNILKKQNDDLTWEELAGPRLKTNLYRSGTIYFEEVGQLMILILNDCRAFNMNITSLFL